MFSECGKDHECVLKTLDACCVLDLPALSAQNVKYGDASILGAITLSILSCFRCVLIRRTPSKPLSLERFWWIITLEPFTEMKINAPHYFPVELFINKWTRRVALTFETVDKILTFDHQIP